jgi:hypothetical protein
MDVLHIMLDYVLSINTPDERYEKISEEDELYKKCEDFLNDHIDELSLRHLDLFNDDGTETIKWKITLYDSSLTKEVVDKSLVIIGNHKTKFARTIELGFSVEVPEGCSCMYIVSGNDGVNYLQGFITKDTTTLKAPLDLFIPNTVNITLALIKRSANLPIILTGDNDND